MVKRALVKKLIEDSRTITIRNFSKYVSQGAVKVDGYDPEGFGFIDFETMELLLMMITHGKRSWAGYLDIKEEDKKLISFEFTIYDLLKLTRSVNEDRYEYIRSLIPKLEEWRMLSIVLDGKVVRYRFPLAMFIKQTEIPISSSKQATLYQVVLSPPATQLLFLDRRIKSTIPFEVLNVYFSLPITLRRLSLFLLNHIRYTLNIQTAMQISNISQNNKSRFLEYLSKYEEQLSFLGIQYEPAKQLIIYSQNKTIIDFQTDKGKDAHSQLFEAINILEKLFPTFHTFEDDKIVNL